MLYAQDPFNTVKSEVRGSTNYMTSVNCHPGEVLSGSWRPTKMMTSTWALQICGGDCLIANRDASCNSGATDKTCADLSATSSAKPAWRRNHHEIMPDAGESNEFRLTPYDWLAHPTTKTSLKTAISKAYAFRTKQSCFPVLAWPRRRHYLDVVEQLPGADGADNHIGFSGVRPAMMTLCGTAARSPAPGTRFSKSPSRHRAAFIS